MSIELSIDRGWQRMGVLYIRQLLVLDSLSIAVAPARFLLYGFCR